MTDLLLAFDTATPVGSVALGRGGEVLAHATLAADARHAETLLPAVDKLLRRAGVSPADLDGVVLGGGPGSFTGVRIAGATAKGMVRALGVPLYAHSSLLALAGAAVLAEEVRTDAVCALLDARRGEVYAGCWRLDPQRAPETLLAPRVAPVAEVVAALDGEDVLWVGQGAGRYESELGAGAVLCPALHPDARALLQLTALDPAACRVTEPATWEPAYLRASGAERGVRG